MKPIIKVWCLPKLTEEQLRQLHAEIVAAVAKVEGLGLKDEDDMVILFPSDMMSYGLGEEIIIEATLLKRPQTASAMTRQECLAKALGTMMDKMFPKADVECFISLFDMDQGFWSNEIR